MANDINDKNLLNHAVRHYVPTPQHAQQIKQEQKLEQGQQVETGPGGKKISAKDAERIAAQSGFSRTSRRNKVFDIGDATQAPIPLPADDVDPNGWSQRLMDEAREHLTLEGGVFAGVAEEIEAEEASLFEALVGCIFKPVERDMSRLQSLQEAPPASVPPEQLRAVLENVNQLFALGLPGAQPGEVMLAAGLVVGGEVEQVRAVDGQLDVKALATGAQHLLQSGGTALVQAQEMNEGINKELNMQRTFVFKR